MGEPDSTHVEDASNRRSGTSTGPDGPAWRILVADDNDIGAEALGDYLEAFGFAVTRARDGGEAVSSAFAHRPDAILMDALMPVMGGEEATALIRANPDLASVPIIMLTALAMPGDRERLLSVGADAYLTKPARLSEIVQAIRTQLTKRQE
jgi:CheY-like chemotaxis protein